MVKQRASSRNSNASSEDISSSVQSADSSSQGVKNGAQAKNSSWCVLKFGGTSVSNTESWPRIRDILIEKLKDPACKVMLVASALSGVSDLLEKLPRLAAQGEDTSQSLSSFYEKHYFFGRHLGLEVETLLSHYFEQLERLLCAARLSGEATPRLQAQVMALGELISTKIISAWLNREGVNTVCLDAREMVRSCHSSFERSAQQHYLSAQCTAVRDRELSQQLSEKNERIFVTQGFIAEDQQGETVVLGRGGSDTSAGYLAAALGSATLEIWTDVPGVFTANPNQVPGSRLLRELDYRELQLMAEAGTEVIHPAAVEQVRGDSIPIIVRSTFYPDVPGTRITAARNNKLKSPEIHAISLRPVCGLLTVDRAGKGQVKDFLTEVTSALDSVPVSADVFAASSNTLHATLDAFAGEDLKPAVAHLRSIFSGLYKSVYHEKAYVLTLFGSGVLRALSDGLPNFSELGDAQLLGSSADQTCLSFLFSAEIGMEHIRQLHAELFCEASEHECFGPTWAEIVDQKTRTTNTTIFESAEAL